MAREGWERTDGTRRGRWDGKGGRDGRERIEGVEWNGIGREGIEGVVWHRIGWEGNMTRAQNPFSMFNIGEFTFNKKL